MARFARLRFAARLGVAGIASLALVSHSASASVGDELESFFDDMGAAANVTGPTAFQGQAAGYYSGGSVYARFPQKSVSPVNIQLPKVNAGCGGIDIFAGSFSFINSDEMIAMMKATANNALGFAFHLALKSISPMIANTMEDLRSAAQKMNDLNISSCETAQTAVVGMLGEMGSRDTELCRYIGNSQGKFSDWARGRVGCNNAAEQGATLAGNTDDDIPAESYNYTWTMLGDSYPGFSREFREYLMTMVGTIIYERVGEDGADASNVEFVGNYIGLGDTEIIEALLDGGGAKILRCDEATKCLDPTLTTTTVSAEDALLPKVKSLMQSINGKIQADGALSADELGLLGMTSIPLYKILTVNAATRLGGMNSEEMDQLARMVAVELLDSVVRHFYSYVAKGQASFQQADKSSLQQWRQQIDAVAGVISEQSKLLHRRVQTTQLVVERTVFLEKQMRNKLNPQLRGALDFMPSSASSSVTR